jgi:gamma-glutamylaminecyclotransferase
MGKSILFVYGTLKRGQRNHHLLAAQQFLGNATTEPRYRIVDLGPYPGLVAIHENGLAVRGELWTVDDNCLRQLDTFEGVPDLFDRRPVAIPGWKEVHAYFWNGAIAPSAASGNIWPFSKELRR